MPIQFLNRKLLKFPIVIVVHIAIVAGVFKLVYPEVNISSLSTVIAGVGLCLALATEYVYSKITKNKEDAGASLETEKKTNEEK